MRAAPPAARPPSPCTPPAAASPPPPPARRRRRGPPPPAAAPLRQLKGSGLRAQSGVGRSAGRLRAAHLQLLGELLRRSLRDGVLASDGDLPRLAKGERGGRHLLLDRLQPRLRRRRPRRLATELILERGHLDRSHLVEALLRLGERRLIAGAEAGASAAASGVGCSGAGVASVRARSLACCFRWAARVSAASLAAARSRSSFAATSSCTNWWRCWSAPSCSPCSRASSCNSHFS